MSSCLRLASLSSLSFLLFSVLPYSSRQLPLPYRFLHFSVTLPSFFTLLPPSLFHLFPTNLHIIFYFIYFSSYLLFHISSSFFLFFFLLSSPLIFFNVLSILHLFALKVWDDKRSGRTPVASARVPVGVLPIIKKVSSISKYD